MKLFLAALFALLGACGSSGSPPCDGEEQPCDSDVDCEGGACVADPAFAGNDLDPLTLVCVGDDPVSDVGQRCEQAGDCARGICLLAGTCAVPCVEDADCGDGQRCARSHARGANTALHPVEACVSIADLPPGGEMQSEVLEGFLTGSNGEQLDLTPAADTSIFVLEHLAEDAWPAFKNCRSPICVNLLRTRDAEPVVLFDAGLYGQQWLGNEEPPLNPVAVGTPLVAYERHPTTLMLPNGPRSVLSDSGFEVELEWEKPGSVRSTRLTRKDPGVLLDLNLFYAGGRDWEPTGSRGPPFLEDALNHFEEIYEKGAGISIGEVRQFEVGGAMRERLQVVAERYGVLETLPELLALSAGSGNPAINLFFVKKIDDAWAISGGTPGPLGMQGTGASGIAFSTDSIEDANDLGKIIAHEIGHHLGLFHTSEMEGYVLDPLPDTPECRIDRDQDGDGVLIAQECVGFGADNLMFWALAGAEEITEDQAAVLRSALILH
jgi:hypothetical protein